MIEIFEQDDVGISVGHNNEEFSTYAASVDSEKKAFKKIFGFKIALKNHGFLEDINMLRPRKYYLIKATYLDRDTQQIVSFFIPLSRDDCISGENLKLELHKVSKIRDGMSKIITLIMFIFINKCLNYITVRIDENMVKKTKLYLKLQNAFDIYDKNANVKESIICNGRGFLKLRSLQHPIYVVSELQALSCGQEQARVDEMDLVYLPKKLLQQKVTTI